MAKFSVKESTSAKFTATIKDEDGSAIPASSLTTAALTLYDLDTGTVLNSRNGQDVLNANDVTISEAGVLTWVMTPDDNAMNDSNKKHERHRALFAFTWDAGAKKSVHEVDFDVENIDKYS